MRILFMGTPDLAKESLESLDKQGHSIIGVVTNPDKPKGRGMKMGISPVKEYAISRGLTIYQPEKVKNNEQFTQIIQNLVPELIVAVAYGKILPKEILEIPTLGCINLHFSLLPKYRGAAPINWPILNGDTVTGVTTMYMDEKMDAGDIILQQEVSIGKQETAGELWNKLSTIGANLLVKTVELIEKGENPRIKQPEDNYTLAPMLNKEMSKIDWNTMTAKQINNLVRGLNPMMGVYTLYDTKKIKFWKIEVSNNEQIGITKKAPGTILQADEKLGMFIQTIDGVIKIIEIQGENAKRMIVQDFLRGNKLEVGKRFKS